MKSTFPIRSVLAATAALGLLAAGSAAHAGDVSLSIGVHAPLGYVQPAPVYVQPAQVYVQPEPVYVQPRPVYVQPRTVYYQDGYRYGHHGRRGPWGDADRDGVPNAYDRDSRYRHRSYGWRDADRDGVPNRYDQAPHNPYYR